MRTTRNLIRILGIAAVGAIATAGAAKAQVMNADVGVNPTYEQTLGGVTSTGGFFSARAFVTSSGDYTGGSLTYGGSGSPAALSYVPGDIGWEFSDSNASFSALQTLYPTGDYVFSLTGGSQPSTSIGIDYEGGAYSNTPEITNFAALQGLNASKSFTVDLNPYVPGSVANDSIIFFSITNASGDVVFSPAGFSDTTTSITIPAGTLLAGGAYSFDLLYSNRITGFDSINSYPVTQFYDTHTDGAFSTAAPEPSTWAMLLMGFVGLGVMVRRRAIASGTLKA
jgi:hypothetical protein